MRSQTKTDGEYQVDILWVNGTADSEDWANPGLPTQEPMGATTAEVKP